MFLCRRFGGWSLRVVRGGGHGAVLCALLVAGLLVPAAAEPAVRSDAGWLEGFGADGAEGGGTGAGADSPPVSRASGPSGGLRPSGTGMPMDGSGDGDDDGDDDDVDEDDDFVVDCDGIDASTGSGLDELLGCVPESPGAGKGPSTSSDPSAQTRSASECGEIDVEYLDQQFLHFRWGFIPLNTRIYVVRLTCEDGSPAENVRTGMRIEGPVNFFTLCTQRSSVGRITFERVSSGRCRSYTVGDPPWAGLIYAHTVIDAQDLRFRRLFFWADLNSNGSHDSGEPYDLAFSPDDNTSAGFRVGDSEGLSVVRGGSRAYGSVTLENALGIPVSDARVGMSVVLGPSRGSALTCVGTPAPATVPGSTCSSDIDGRVALTYRVARNPNRHRQDMDVIRLYLDEDGDGSYDAGEPFTYLTVRIARVPNYVALGDSYSAGENGEAPTTGAYQGGISPADAQCRRWDQAYPYIFTNEYLGIPAPGDNFKTFACTGAITLNIFNPADPNPTAPPGTVHDTDRPSPHAPLGRAVYRGEPPNQRVLGHERDPLWESRQAVSLANVEAMRDVDMITLTIGGNDVGFGDALTACVHPHEFDGSCGTDDLDLTFEEVENRVVSTLDHLRVVAPAASIFVLGYPYLTPALTGCAAPSRVPGSRPGPHAFEHESDQCEMEYNVIRNCKSLSASQVLRASLWGLGANVLSILSTDGRIDYSEASFVQSSAMALNSAIMRAASRSEVHFVDVVSAAHSPGGLLSFVGNSPCESVPWINGFEAEPGRRLNAASGRSFHPNSAGQQGYARILEQYILDAASSGAMLSEAGLPTNPMRAAGTGHGARGNAGSLPRSAEAGESAGAGDFGVASRRSSSSRQATDESPEDTPEASAGFLDAQRVVSSGSACGAAFLMPGEQVQLVAAGFAPGAAVSFLVRAASLDGTELEGLSVPAATAGDDGLLKVAWSVPSAPSSDEDPVPTGYVVDASGPGAGGGTHSAYMVEPVVAYSGTSPCAVPDTAATSLGRPVQIPLLANDVAPAGGSLDASSLWVPPAGDGDFVVDSATGSVTFTPGAGFSGTVAANYWVYDTWGVGVRGDITVTVSAGCTITGTAGATRIEGTDGDDVICVPDPDDRRAFHVIDAKAGNDTVIGGAGVEWIYGGAGDDTVYGRGGDDRIVAGTGADTIHGGLGTDHVYSTDLADTVIDDDYQLVVAPSVTVPQAGPEVSDDWHYADAAQTVAIDVLDNDHDPNEDLDPASLRITRAPSSGTAAVATIDGRTVVEYVAAATGGMDSLAYEICDALSGCATAEVTVMVGTTACTIVGTDASETLNGTAGDDVICGLGGDDVIYGLGGDDVLVGGGGADSLYGGDQTLGGASDGDDVLWGGSGDDALYGGNGNDTLWGADGDDTLHGNRRDDRIHGGPGDDTAVGGGEDDRIWGGPGDDILDGHADDDTVFGGPGDDSVRGGNGDDILWGGSGDDTLIGWAGADALYGGAGADTLNGHTQDDILWGGSGDDTLEGRGHNDQLHGGPGDDTLRGGAHDDRVYGGSGDDILDGGNGTDHLDGGPDADACTRGDTATGCETEARRT